MPTSFQGVPEFDFSTSGPGMDLYMEISGRAINTKGDTVLLAENLMEEMTVSLDSNFHLAIRSSGKVSANSTFVRVMFPLSLESDLFRWKH